jgi:RNA polymerase sigma-70 factor (ECF subfamily)
MVHAPNHDGVDVSEETALESGDQLRDRVASFYGEALRDVYRYFHRATAGDRRLTEDLTQETFVACVQAARRGVGEAFTMPWLMGVARHKLIDHHRRRSREERNLRVAWSNDAAGPTDDSFVTFDGSDAEVLEALARLQPQHRMALVLRYLDDLPVAEIAASIERSVGATESLLVRARQSLDAELRRSHDG